MCSDNSSEIRGWNSQSNMALCISQNQVSKFAVLLNRTSGCAPLEGKIPDELQLYNCDWNFKRMFYLSYFHFSYVHFLCFNSYAFVPSSMLHFFLYRLKLSILLPLSFFCLFLLSLTRTLKIALANRSKCDNKPAVTVLLILLRNFPWFRLQQNSNMGAYVHTYVRT